MLQIIGWLGCFYLVVKAFEMGTSSAHRVDGHIPESTQSAIVITVAGALAFAIWLYMAGAAVSDAASRIPY